MSRQYCAFCSLTVADKDPGKVKHGDRHYHSHCWTKKKRRDFEYAEADALELQAEQEKLKFPEMPY